LLLQRTLLPHFLPYLLSLILRSCWLLAKLNTTKLSQDRSASRRSSLIFIPINHQVVKSQASLKQVASFYFTSNPKQVGSYSHRTLNQSINQSINHANQSCLKGKGLTECKVSSQKLGLIGLQFTSGLNQALVSSLIVDKSGPCA
jgi:hypothetical protein